MIENSKNNDLIKDIYNNDNVMIKKASTWMDFNNRKYKITYSLDGKIINMKFLMILLDNYMNIYKKTNRIYNKL